MILNNHGLVLKQMILYGAILLIALFFVIYYAQTFEDLETAFQNSSNTYSSIESSISSASLLYMDKYYKNEIGTGTITVRTANLVENHLLKELDLVTNTNDTCTGYALVRKDHNELLKAEAFIECANYKTENYQEWRLGE